MTDYVSCPACKGQGVIGIDETENPGLAEARRNAETGGRKAKRFLERYEQMLALKAVKEQMTDDQALPVL